MNFDSYAHRFADVILNSDYEIRKEIDNVIRSVDLAEVKRRFDEENLKRKESGKKLLMGWQAIINAVFKDQTTANDFQTQFNHADIDHIHISFVSIDQQNQHQEIVTGYFNI